MSRRGIIAGSIGVTLLAGAALRAGMRRFEIEESSMEPALEPGDWVFAKRRTGVPDRGDIVVMDDPMGTGMNLVKRVIGLPGEEMGIENSRVTVNGALLADRWATGVTAPDGSWSVSDEEIWVLGDNRPRSRSDGRLFGPSPIDTVHWQVLARYWPSTKAGMIG